ncbi:MAG: radical SAM protein [Candidatus Woesearchaeota archaeon]
MNIFYRNKVFYDFLKLVEDRKILPLILKYYTKKHVAKYAIRISSKISRKQTNKKIDLLLINPPQRYFLFSGRNFSETYIPNEEPLGLFSIASFLAKRGVCCQVVDWNVSDTSLSCVDLLIKQTKPRIVGISAITRQTEKAYIIGRHIKQSHPSVAVVYGGVHPTLFPKEPFAKGCADYVVCGEGEETLYELWQNLDADKKGIAGLCYKHNGRVIINPPRKHLKPNLMPICKHKRMYNTNIHVRELAKKRTFPIMTSRGCVYNCSYCAIPSIWKRTFRQRTVESVISEIKSATAMGFECAHFYDDDFLLRPSFVEHLCRKLISENIRLRWLCQASSRNVVKNRRLLPLMKKAGCDVVEIGVESADKNVLKKICKLQTKTDISKALNLLKKNDIEPILLMMAFNMGETLDSVYKTARFLEKIGAWSTDMLKDHRKYFNRFSPPECNSTPYYHGFFATPIPGSRFYEIARKEGMVFCSSPNEYYFGLINFVPNEFLTDTPRKAVILNKRGFTAFLKPFHSVLEYERLIINSMRYLNESYISRGTMTESLWRLYEQSDGKLKVLELAKDDLQTSCFLLRILATVGLIRGRK